MSEEMASIGKSIVINGELSGSEDLTIEGRVDGKIELRDHVLTVGTNGRIKAQVSAKAIVVLGSVTGNLNATEKVDIKESGSVEGDIVAPRVAIADGSHFRGSIDMQKKDGAADKTHFNKPEAKSPKTEKTDKTDSVPVNGEFARV
jgi:cytoskeletal protein CcmA (bactofilin family)